MKHRVYNLYTIYYKTHWTGGHSFSTTTRKCHVLKYYNKRTVNVAPIEK